MLEILGIVFGGLSRMGQHWMEMKDKDRERLHEQAMFDKQVALQAQKIDAERDLRQMDVDSIKDSKELDALMAAIQDQSAQAVAAGGFILKLSASVRPVQTYWLLAIYSVSKAAVMYLMMTSGVSLAESLKAAYTEFDGALLGSVTAYWFADRSLRKSP
jgi:hypothetical protein